MVNFIFKIWILDSMITPRGSTVLLVSVRQWFQYRYETWELDKKVDLNWIKKLHESGDQYSRIGYCGKLRGLSNRPQWTGLISTDLPMAETAASIAKLTLQEQEVLEYMFGHYRQLAKGQPAAISAVNSLSLKLRPLWEKEP